MDNKKRSGHNFSEKAPVDNATGISEDKNFVSGILAEEKNGYEAFRLGLKNNSKNTFYHFLVISVLQSIVVFALLSCINGKKISEAAVISIGCGVIIGAILAPIFKMMLVKLENSLLDKIFADRINHIHDNVQENIFENYIKLTDTYLQQYYAQVRQQAKNGFTVTICVAVIGATLIGAGTVTMIAGKTNPSYITCASGVITEFISAIFFYLYNKTASSMGKYHNKLILSHNISVALKVADTLPEEDQVKTKSLIVSELLKDINSYLIRNDTDNGADDQKHPVDDIIKN